MEKGFHDSLNCLLLIQPARGRALTPMKLRFAPEDHPQADNALPTAFGQSFRSSILPSSPPCTVASVGATAWEPRETGPPTSRARGRRLLASWLAAAGSTLLSI